MFVSRSQNFKPKNDVLYSNIQGTGLIAFLKRFYCEMFMLSYSDKRSRHYLVTPQAMAKERARHYKRYPSTIHPFSMFRCLWEHFMLIVCILKMTALSYNTSIFEEHVNPLFWFTGFFCEFFTVVDLYVSAKTGYVDENSKAIILDPKLILIKFFSTRIFFHAIGSIPLHGILYLRNGLSPTDCSLCNSSIFVTSIRFLSTLSLVRYYDATVFLERDDSHGFIKTACGRLLRIITLAYMTNYWIWTIHHSLYILYIILYNKVEETVSTDILVSWYEKEPSKRPSFFYLLLHDMCRYMFLHSMDPEIEIDVFEKFTMIIAFLSSNIFYMWTIMLGFDVAFHVLFTEERLMVQVNRAVNMFRVRQLPDVITEKVKSYYQCSEAERLFVEKVDGLYADLPISLKNEIALHCYRKHLCRVPFFDELPTKIMNDIVLLLKEEFYMIGDVVSKKGNKGDGLIMIDKGIAAVYTERGEELAHLIDGDYFDVLSLFSDEQFDVNTVIAVSDIKILFLDKHRFRRLMKKFPDQFFRWRRKLRNAGRPQYF